MKNSENIGINLNKCKVPMGERMPGKLKPRFAFERYDFHMNIRRFAPNEIGINGNRETVLVF